MKFDKTKFTYHGGYLMYGTQFVARFKYRGPVTMARFKAVLLKYYSTENYFARLSAGATPLGILTEDGHLNYTKGKLVLDGKVLN